MNLSQDLAILKRNMEGLTIVNTFYQRGDNLMIKMLATILKDCVSPWAARDVIMSDFFEMFASEERLGYFDWFFVNDTEISNDPQSHYSSPKFQMCV